MAGTAQRAEQYHSQRMRPLPRAAVAAWAEAASAPRVDEMVGGHRASSETWTS